MKFSRVHNPNQYASGYTLDLYCDRDRNAWDHRWDQSFYDQTFRECAKEARRVGWTIHKDGTATCPVCNKGK
jgi:hypothetical protein